ncbi:MAG: glutamate racemase [Sphingobacteriales bacterium]|nr:MAG: glutamate racemase [Sphingobacteriales bacterium]TAF82692.1 MAG: glutamate racemase [Sphingobacteriales bacterium]
MILKNKPIGIFDSGIGGLTVANAIREALPHETLIYFGDTAHMPYGDKSAEAIKYYSLKIAKFLQLLECKAIIIACNTASSLGYKDVKDFLGYNLPILNVIDPVVNYITQQGQYKSIGVIGTKATIKSGVYQSKLASALPHLNVKAMATPLLAPMIEEGFFENNISKTIINTYLSSPKLKNIEAIVLACTHYPLIQNEIRQFYNGKIDILNTAQIMALNVKQQLLEKNLLSDTKVAKHQFFVSDKTTSFENSTRIFFGNKINLQQKNIWSV